MAARRRGAARAAGAGARRAPAALPARARARCLVTTPTRGLRTDHGAGAPPGLARAVGRSARLLRLHRGIRARGAEARSGPERAGARTDRASRVAWRRGR